MCSAIPQCALTLPLQQPTPPGLLPPTHPMAHRSTAPARKCDQVAHCLAAEGASHPATCTCDLECWLWGVCLHPLTAVWLTVQLVCCTCCAAARCIWCWCCLPACLCCAAAVRQARPGPCVPTESGKSQESAALLPVSAVYIRRMVGAMHMHCFNASDMHPWAPTYMCIH